MGNRPCRIQHLCHRDHRLTLSKVSCDTIPSLCFSAGTDFRCAVSYYTQLRDTICGSAWFSCHHENGGGNFSPHQGQKNRGMTLGQGVKQEKLCKNILLLL